MNFKRLTPRSTIITLTILVILIGLGGLIYKNLQKNGMLPEAESEITPPTKVVQDFYNWYMNYRGNPVESGAYRYLEELTPGLIEDIDNRMGKGKLSYDPFSCGAGKPLGVAVIREEIKDTNANVVINTDYGNNVEINLKMVLENKAWKVVSIDCPQIEEQKKIDEEKAKQKVTIFLLNTLKTKANEDKCTTVHKVERSVESSADPIPVALDELFRGTTKEESDALYTSIFSDKTVGMLGGVRFIENTAFVALRGFEDFKNTKNECEINSFKAQIEQTIKGYKDITEVVFE